MKYLGVVVSVVLASFIFLDKAPLSSGNDLMFRVSAGKEECFYQDVKQNQTLYVEYSVVSSTHGELDINFQLSDPKRGKLVLTEFRKADAKHDLPISEPGEYRACFDNTFSHFSHKTIAFHMSTYSDSDTQWQDYEIQHEQENQLEMTTKEIKEIVERVRVHMNKIEVVQSNFRITELKDRGIAENNYERVNFWSLVYVLVLVSVGVIQVLVVKSMFTYPNERSIPKW